VTKADTDKNTFVNFASPNFFYQVRYATLSIKQFTFLGTTLDKVTVTVAARSKAAADR